MSGYFEDRRVTVTGGAGFLGSFVVEALARRGCRSVFVPRSCQYDLTKAAHVRKLYEDSRPDIVIHLAARVGGIGANQKNPGRFFYENLIMSTELMEQGRVYGVEKFVAIGTVCSYPKFCPVPFHEDDIWAGYPEETNAPYGLAKKMMLVQSQAYREQYGVNYIFLLPANLYGPGDNFDLETSHVIPALIRKFSQAVDSKQDEVVIWGDGTASREFLFAADAAEGILLATEHYNESSPVNLGSGREVTIRELTSLLAGLIGYKGRMKWDSGKPNGQPRRVLDVTRARQEFGFTAQTTLEEGLAATIEWYNLNLRYSPESRG